MGNNVDVHNQKSYNPHSWIAYKKLNAEKLEDLFTSTQLIGDMQSLLIPELLGRKALKLQCRLESHAKSVIARISGPEDQNTRVSDSEGLG